VYFLKVYTINNALDIARGEFESTQALASIIHTNFPKAVGYGICAGDSNRAFYLAEFQRMKDELPAVSDLVSVVAKLHQKPSPSG
jgi:hypothetical protein